MDNHDMIIVLDFGAQYSQLIARRVRECGVYSQIYPFTVSADEIRRLGPKGIIFSGAFTLWVAGNFMKRYIAGS